MADLTLALARALVESDRDLTPLDRCEIRLACDQARRRWWSHAWHTAMPAAPEDAFEAWLIEKWLRQIRSPEFAESVQGERLIAEWERG